MFDSFEIQGARGNYEVAFVSDVDAALDSRFQRTRLFYVVDAKFSALYPRFAENAARQGRPVLAIEASEDAKSLACVHDHLNAVLDLGLRRGDVLVAFGGGVIQDIVGFMASIIFRGIQWAFVPTTLVAQADSCIGSKTSVNLGNRKNALGTFHNPVAILIDTSFLITLGDADIRSGIGEMLKIHAIRGPKEFDSLALHCAGVRRHERGTGAFVHASLQYKKEIIELDERDSGPRLVMNYGHSFGHAIEVASEFRIPHGIAVTMGMDVANYIALVLGFGTRDSFDRMHPALLENAGIYWELELDPTSYETALSQDKKNTAQELVLVLPNQRGIPELTHIPLPNDVVSTSLTYLNGLRQ